MTIDFKAITNLVGAPGNIANNVTTKITDTLGVSANTINTIRNSATAFTQNPVGALAQNLQFDSIDQLLPTLGSTVGTNTGGDNRIRLRPMLAATDQVYGPNDGSNILTILRDTGLMFPYTPAIEWMQAVEYSSTSLTHTNQDYQIYKNTPSTTLRVSGDFTIQNEREGQYMLAVIHFLRTVSKMYFGKQSKTPGMPPPVLLFSGYGEFMFNDLPVIVKDHAYSLGKDVSYIDVVTGGGTARLPAILTISMTLIVQNTPKKLREEFDLDQFRTGALMKKKGWI